jgi:hypothetical protein
MPRQARLDVPGTLHHVILRGMERGRIGADRQDREAFVARLGAVATATGITISAWALLPNHVHLLLIPRWCRRARIGREELELGSRRRRIAAVRSKLAVPLVTQLGLSLADAARQLGVSTSGVAKAVARAEQQ